MDTNFEQKVRERAYEIWVSAGMADGMAHEHWAEAEQAVKSETAPAKAAKTAAPKLKAAPKAKAAVKPATVKPAAAKAKATVRGSDARH